MPTRLIQRPRGIFVIVCKRKKIMLNTLTVRRRKYEHKDVEAFYPRDAMLARVFAIATCPSVCPSVRLSAARRYCA